MTNTLQAETRNLLTEYATASFEELEHRPRELESKVALTEVASLPKALKATYLADAGRNPTGYACSGKAHGGSCHRQLPVKDSPIAVSDERPGTMTRGQRRVENRAAPAQERELGCGHLVACVVFELEAEPSEYLLHRTVLPQHLRCDRMTPLRFGQKVEACPARDSSEIPLPASPSRETS